MIRGLDLFICSFCGVLYSYYIGFGFPCCILYGIPYTVPSRVNSLSYTLGCTYYRGLGFFRSIFCRVLYLYYRPVSYTLYCLLYSY
jgi:hypothetical protein